MREEIVRAARALDALGFMQGKPGNVSCRTPGGFLIMPYAEAGPGDLVEMTADGAVLSGARKPSSKWRLHAARPQAAAVVHTHSPMATALSCARARAFRRCTT